MIKYLLAIFLLVNIVRAQDTPKIFVWTDRSPTMLVYYNDYLNGYDNAWLDCGVGKLDNKGNSCTPSGDFKVIGMSKDPWYYDVHGVLVARDYNHDHNNVYGTRVIQLDYIRHGRHLCIHGTNEPNLIPGWVSHMCIRLKNKDVEWLYDHVRIGDIVEIN